MKIGQIFMRIGVMRRRLKTLIAGSLLGTLAACGHKHSFPEASCTRVNVTSNGNPVIGVEDMAYDAQSRTLYLSAYDRRGHNKGGIYRLNINYTDTDLIAASIMENIRPHGIELTRDGQKLMLDFIDRQGPQENKRPVIRNLSWNDDLPDNISEAPPIIEDKLCASNDLTRSIDGVIFVTQDHKSCTSQDQKRENILSPKQASVSLIYQEDGALKLINHLSGLSFANGVALSAKAELLYVAETRRKQIVVSAPDYLKNFPIKLAGGPDNLTRHADNIYAALIPSLIKFSRFQKNKQRRIKSRFAIISPTYPSKEKPSERPATFNVSTYDVPASVISGATVALKAGDHIWLGAAYDTAIARCTLPEIAP